MSVAFRDFRKTQPSQIVAVARVAFSKDDVDFLCFGESDYSSPPVAIEALKHAIGDKKNTRYPDIRGIPEFRTAIADYLSDLHGVKIDERRIQVTASGMAAISVAYSALVHAGDKIVMHGPAWPNIRNLAHLRGADVQEVPLRLTENGFQLDLSELERALDGASVFFLNSPNNPTGWSATHEELKAILALCRPRGVWIVSDEVYSRLFYGQSKAAPSVLEVASPEDRIIVCNSFSKTWAMTGWRMGWMVLPEGERDSIGEIVELTHSGVAPFSQLAALAALKDTQFVTDFHAYCRQGRLIAERELSDLDDVRFVLPDGAFYAFLHVKKLADSFSMAMKLVERHGVAVAPGSAFGAAGERYLRLCFAKSPEQLIRAISRLKQGLRKELK